MSLLKNISALLLFCGIIFTAKSQFQDNFSDGEFTSNPAWFGNRDNFQVSASQELQLNDTSKAGSSQLFANSKAIKNASWKVSFRLEFNPSSANYLRLFLAADNPDEPLAGESVFLFAGGTEDHIQLIHRKQDVNEVILSSEEKILDLSVVTSEAIVTVDSLGKWSLFLGLDSAAPSLISTAIYPVTFSPNAFVIDCKYTSTRSDKFSFDNIEVIGNPENSPPKVTSLTARPSGNITIAFSEALDTNSAVSPSNYTLSSHTAVPEIKDSASVNLSFSPSLSTNANYQLSLSNILDLAGNSIKDTTLFFQIPDTSSIQSGDIYITEIMADPSPSAGLPEAEYIEVYNFSDKVISSSQFSLINTTTRILFFGEYSILPNQHYILIDVKDSALFSSFSNTIYCSTFPALSNTSDSLSIVNKNDQLIDYVSYSAAWYQNPDKDDGGFSLEKSVYNSPCKGQDNWRAANVNGTPASLNSFAIVDGSKLPFMAGNLEYISDSTIFVSFSKTLSPNSIQNIESDAGLFTANQVDTCSNCYLLIFSEPLGFGKQYTFDFSSVLDCFGASPSPSLLTFTTPIPLAIGSVVITEVFSDPTPSFGLPEIEYLEIFNTTNDTLSLSGWNLENSGSKRSFPNTVLFPGQYRVVSRVGSDTAYPNAIEIISWQALSNGGDSIGLSDNYGQLQDVIVYDLDWHTNSEAKDGGVSLEAISPGKNCVGRANFSSSSHPSGGTPGYENSLFSNDLTLLKPFVIGIELKDSSSILVSFSQPITSTPSVTLKGKSVLGTQFYTDSLLVSFSPHSTAGDTITFTISQAYNCVNLSLTDSVFTLISPYLPRLGDIIFTEVYADPSPSNGLPNFEYVELYNRSDKNIDLSNLKLNSVLLPKKTIFPGQFIAVGAVGISAAYFNSEDIVGSELSSTFFTNSGKSLSLTNTSGNDIDRLDYSVLWHNQSARDGGYSLELIKLNLSCRNHSNYWQTSQSPNGGTPGSANSEFTLDNEVFHISDSWFKSDSLTLVFSDLFSSVQVNSESGTFNNCISVPIQANQLEINLTATSCNSAEVLDTTFSFAYPSLNQQALILNEVFYDPIDDEPDYFEIYNPSENPIWLYNLSFVHNSSSTEELNMLDTLGHIIAPDGYLAFTANKTALAEAFPRHGNILEAYSFQNLVNSSGEITLADSDQQLFERASYNDNQHFSKLLSTEGVSLERISAEGNSSDPNNWTSASESVGFATPGLPNSVNESDNAQVLIDNPTFSPNNDGYRDAVVLSVEGISPNTTLSAYVFSMNGTLINTLSKNRLAGEQESIIWKGDSENGSLTAIGPYLIVVELVAENGNIQVEKQAVVLSP